MGLIGQLAGEEVDEPQWHLHFALGAHKVTDAHHHAMTTEEACKFLENHWSHGRSEVAPYDATKDGLGLHPQVSVRSKFR